MYRKIAFFVFIFLSTLAFAQQASFTIVGRVPGPNDRNLYQIQVGAFRVPQNATRVFERLNNASLNPVYEEFQGLTRVMVRGISAAQVPLYIERIRNIGFSEVYIRIDTRTAPPAVPPAPVTQVPAPAASAPAAPAPIRPPAPASPVLTGYMPPENRPGSSPIRNFSEYRTQQNFGFAYRWNNRGEHWGASGSNGGIDIIARNAANEWLWTTYYQGGWFYDLNGVRREMIDGLQRSSNGVELRVMPEFVMVSGVPHLQLRHILTNTGNVPVRDQRFGASADVMIGDNDYTILSITPYGVSIRDSAENPSLELMFICLTGEGINPVTTLWLGAYGYGSHLNHIYDDRRLNVYDIDSALAFSYQNINLNPGESREFIIRFSIIGN